MRKRRKSNSKPNNRSQEPPVVRTSNRGDICIVPRQQGLTSLVGKMLMTLALVGGASHSIAADVLRRGNQVAWCIVPFDAAKRGPAERAAMLKELGITKCAYDWRAEHVPTFEQEILEYKKQGIEFFAFWSAHDEAFKLFKKYNLHPQIWQTLSDPGGDDSAKVEAATQLMLPLAKRTAGLGCKLGLYNHGGWGGEPANLVAVCRRLRELGQGHVGIVYNFHHGHGHIDDWAASFRLMKPYLHCLNLNGMNDAAQPKILGIGKGAHELDMIRVVVESGYDGPIGILDHRDQLDARKSLIENRDGLEWVRKEIEKPGSGGPKPIAPAAPMPKKQAAVDGGRIVPGSDAYRHPPITVEVRVNLSRRDRYNILVASDSKASANHWELFTMNGSGYLTAYLPGKTPDHVRSEAMVCDGKPHTLSMTYAPDRVQLFVDGKRVADEPIADRDDGTAVPGALAIGRLAVAGESEVGHLLRELLESASPSLQLAAIRGLVYEISAGNARMFSAIARNTSYDPSVRAEALLALTTQPFDEPVGLLPLLDDQDGAVRTEALLPPDQTTAVDEVRRALENRLNQDPVEEVGLIEIV